MRPKMKVIKKKKVYLIRILMSKYMRIRHLLVKKLKNEYSLSIYAVHHS